MFSLSATQRGVVVAPTAATLKTTKRSSSARRASKLQAKEAEAEADAAADADAEATGDDSEDASSEEEKPKDRGIFKMFAPDGEVNASDYNKFKAKMEEEKKRKQEEYAKKGKKKFLGLL